MNPRSAAFGSLSLACASVLGTLSAAYGLVYPSGARGSKLLLGCAIGAGALCIVGAGALALAARRRSKSQPERFFAFLGLALGSFFLFVVLLGFGIPALFMGLHD